MRSKLSITLTLFLVLGLFGQANAVTVPVGFDFLGGGGSSGFTGQVKTFDYSPSSALALFDTNIPITVGQEFQLYTHGSVGVFKDLGGNTINPGTPNPFEVTVVMGFRERVTTVTDLSPPLSNNQSLATFSTVSGGVNFFEMYYHSPITSDSDLSDGRAGEGFAGGTLLLSGTVNSGDGQFQVTDGSFPFGLLDQNGADGASGTAGFGPTGSENDPQYTVDGTGSSVIKIFVDINTINPDYFYDVPEGFTLSLEFNNNQKVPFAQVDPSNYYYDGSVTKLITDFGGIVGQVNGGTGNAILLQVDGNQTQELQAVPEPGTIILLGSGLLALAVVGRKRMKMGA